LKNIKILIIDLETTGFLNQEAAIVEVGIVTLHLSTGHREIVFNTICRESHLSARHRTYPMGWIFENSTLTVEDVRQAPLLKDLLPEIQDLIDAHPAGATAYNRSFDFDFLESRGIKFGNKLPCPMIVSTPVCQLPSRHQDHGLYKWPKVEETWEFLFPDKPYTELHRAADDAYHEALIVWELYKLGLFEI